MAPVPKGSQPTGKEGYTRPSPSKVPSAVGKMRTGFMAVCGEVGCPSLPGVAKEGFLEEEMLK